MVVDMAATVFPPTLESVRAARRFVREVLVERNLPSATAELLVSELATNAVWHAASPFAVLVHVNGRIRVEVADDSPVRPRVVEPDEWCESGRGLVLVRSLADDWGVDADGNGKTVWFEVPLEDDEELAP